MFISFFRKGREKRTGLDLRCELVKLKKMFNFPLDGFDSLEIPFEYFTKKNDR